jgi:hypothetical protein
MPLIEYIGSKPRKADNVAGTGAVWLGAGDAQEVPESAVAALLAHKTVWRLAEASLSAPAAAAEAESQPAEPAAEPQYRFVLMDDSAEGGPKAIVLDTMDADQLAAFADAAGIKVDGRVKDLDKRRAAIYEAATKG